MQLRNRREELAAELANLRTAAAALPLEASQSQPSQASSSDELADALNAFSI